MDDHTTNARVRKAPTLYDVAALAGVSHQTVSRLVKGHTNIGPEMRSRIEAAIATLNYKPNMSARSLATSKPHRIGALVYEILEVGPSKTMHGASVAAREAGYLLDIVSLDPNDDHAIEAAITLINQNDLAGVIVFAPTDGVLAALSRVSFTVPVFIESEANDLADATDPTLNEMGMRLLVEQLIRDGHRRFFHIAGPLDWLAARGRRDAYERALRAAGATSAGMIAGTRTSQSGYEAAMAMPLNQGITAVVAGNDQMALGALRALDERGIRVPEKVSVTGFDDIPESRFFFPSLTTVRVDLDLQGRIAFNRLLALINQEQVRPALVPVMPQVFVRDSSAAAPSGA
jgi:LacI family transcriptional regulator